MWCTGIRPWKRLVSVYWDWMKRVMGDRSICQVERLSALWLWTYSLDVESAEVTWKHHFSSLWTIKHGLIVGQLAVFVRCFAWSLWVFVLFWNRAVFGPHKRQGLANWVLCVERTVWIVVCTVVTAQVLFRVQFSCNLISALLSVDSCKNGAEYCFIVSLLM